MEAEHQGPWRPPHRLSPTLNPRSRTVRQPAEATPAMCSSAGVECRARWRESGHHVSHERGCRWQRTICSNAEVRSVLLVAEAAEYAGSLFQLQIRVFPYGTRLLAAQHLRRGVGGGDPAPGRSSGVDAASPRLASPRLIPSWG